MKRRGRLLLYSVALAVLGFSIQGAAAACASPSGVAGQLQFTASDMKFCDGSAWQSMKGSATASCAGAVAGKLQYVPASDFVWHDGASCWSAKGSTTYGACPVNGQWAWDSSNSVLKGCIGGTWYALKPAVASGDSLPHTVDWSAGNDGWTFSGVASRISTGGQNALGQAAFDYLGGLGTVSKTVNFPVPSQLRIYTMFGSPGNLTIKVAGTIVGAVQVRELQWTLHGPYAVPAGPVLVEFISNVNNEYDDTKYVSSVSFAAP